MTDFFIGQPFFYCLHLSCRTDPVVPVQVNDDQSEYLLFDCIERPNTFQHFDSLLDQLDGIIESLWIDSIIRAI